jgi:hypothetical protein
MTNKYYVKECYDQVFGREFIVFKKKLPRDTQVCIYINFDTALRKAFELNEAEKDIIK